MNWKPKILPIEPNMALYSLSRMWSKDFWEAPWPNSGWLQFLSCSWNPTSQNLLFVLSYFNTWYSEFRPGVDNIYIYIYYDLETNPHIVQIPCIHHILSTSGWFYVLVRSSFRALARNLRKRELRMARLHDVTEVGRSWQRVGRRGAWAQGSFKWGVYKGHGFRTSK